jgi:hypothetical protein
LKIVQRPLSLILLLLVLLVCGIAIARTRTVRNNHTALNVGCAEDCKEKLDKMLERCTQLPEARQSRCQEGANEHYNKCMEKCGDRSR